MFIPNAHYPNMCSLLEMCGGITMAERWSHCQRFLHDCRDPLQLESLAWQVVVPPGVPCDKPPCVLRSEYTQQMLRLVTNCTKYPPNREVAPAVLMQQDHTLLRHNAQSEYQKTVDNIAELHKILEDDTIDFDMDQYKKQLKRYKRCGDELMITMKQTRSGDEGMTMIVLPCKNPKCS